MKVFLALFDPKHKDHFYGSIAKTVPTYLLTSYLQLFLNECSHVIIIQDFCFLFHGAWVKMRGCHVKYSLDVFSNENLKLR